MSIFDLFAMSINEFFINRLVKNARGFSPGKKLGGGKTIYELSMSLLGTLLIRRARRAGPIDVERLRVLERVQGHFSEHVMFRNFPRPEAVGILNDMNNDYDSMGHFEFDREFDRFAADLGRQLPLIVRREIVAHLAMFQRVDQVKIDDAGRRSAVRDEYGLLFGRVTQADIDGILNGAAGYTLEE